MRRLSYQLSETLCWRSVSGSGLSRDYATRGEDLSKQLRRSAVQILTKT